MTAQQHLNPSALTAIASASGAVQIRFTDRVTRELTHVLERVLSQIVPTCEKLCVGLEKRVVISTIFLAIEGEQIAPHCSSGESSKQLLLTVSKTLYANRSAYDSLFTEMSKNWQAVCAKITAAVLTYFKR